MDSLITVLQQARHAAGLGGLCGHLGDQLQLYELAWDLKTLEKQLLGTEQQSQREGYARKSRSRSWFKTAAKSG